MKKEVNGGKGSVQANVESSDKCVDKIQAKAFCRGDSPEELGTAWDRPKDGGETCQGISGNRNSTHI